jgi:hypothetical protein
LGTRWAHVGQREIVAWVEDVVFDAPLLLLLSLLGGRRLELSAGPVQKDGAEETGDGLDILARVGGLVGARAERGVDFGSMLGEEVECGLDGRARDDGLGEGALDFDSFDRKRSESVETSLNKHRSSELGSRSS